MPMNLRKQIDPDARYTPAQLARLGVIRGPRGGTSRMVILDLINAGRLNSTNAGLGRQPQWVITGEEVLRYLDNQ